MRSGLNELIPVRWPAAEEPAFQCGLRRHGGADADLDPVAFGLAHSPEHRHDQVVRLVIWVERPADLRHPQLNSIVDEQGERQSELVAVEGAVRLADHDGAEAAVRVA